MTDLDLWYPKAIRLPKGNVSDGTHYTQTQSQMVPRALILHSAAGAGRGVRNYLLTNPDGLESHLDVAYDGTPYQFVPCNWTADANLNANPFAVSIESDSTVDADDAWTEAQVMTIMAIGRWLNSVAPVPLREIESPTGSGIGWHSMWGYNSKANPHINPWTKAIGKTCPGLPYRVDQAKMIIGLLERGVVPEKEDDMPFIVRCDGHGPLILTDGLHRLQISNARRAALLDQKMADEVNVTGNPDAYDLLLEDTKPV